MTTIPYLDLDCISVERAVIELLPPEIAYRYHALPVARDGNNVTVAMAAPEDQAACCAVQTAINAPVCLIQADAAEIDQRLDQIWPRIPERMKFLFWPLTTGSNRAYNITKGIARPMQAVLVRVDPPDAGQNPLEVLERAIQQLKPDLLILQADQPGKLRQSLFGCRGKLPDSRLPNLLIMPPDPSLPIKKLLLVLPDSGSGCEEAAAWVLRFSKLNRVEVSILPLLPPVPLWYGSYLRYDLDSLLRGNDQLGSILRCISEQFSHGNIQARFKIREGDPFNQIRDEILSQDPDLVIMPSSPQVGQDLGICTDLAGMLFKNITKPVLITNRN